MEPQTAWIVTKPDVDGKSLFWIKGIRRRPHWSRRFSLFALYAREGDARRLVKGKGSSHFHHDPEAQVRRLTIAEGI